MPNLLPIGSQAPAFSLPDVTKERLVTLSQFEGRSALIVTFICRHCPYVVHVQEALAQIGHEYQAKNVGMVAISANDADRYPDDAPDKLAEMARLRNFNFAVLYDETQEVAKAYTAQCTPDTFVFDKNQRLVYRGQLDDTRPSAGDKATGADLRAALDAILAGQPVSAEQKPSVGCSIKWKPGNEPA